MKKQEVDSFEHACELRGIDPKVRPDVSMIPKHLQEFILATYECAVIVEAHNEGKRPNWNDGSWKYAPWPDVEADEKRPEGFGFSRTNFDLSDTGAYVGSRLLYLNSEDAKNAPAKFKKHYLGHLLG